MLCFCFCKQKTAYEMRISDWSSDVCSSDLFAGIEVQHEEQKASLDTLGGELEQRKQAVTELQDQQRTAQNELAEVRKQAQEKRGRLSSLETLQHAALGQERSEEHTSELPSLMRISYAVFCL